MQALLCALSLWTAPQPAAPLSVPACMAGLSGLSPISGR